MLARGTVLGTAPLEVTPALAADYLAAVREADPIYAREGLVHPGQVLRLCNQALVQNVVLGPWIHVGSRVRNLAAARVGAVLTARARVTDNAERKGHRFVELDCWVVDGAGAAVAQVLHTAIWAAAAGGLKPPASRVSGVRRGPSRPPRPATRPSRADHPVAFAGEGFETRPVGDGHMAGGVAHEPRRLQLPRGDGDAGAADTQHAVPGIPAG